MTTGGTLRKGLDVFRERGTHVGLPLRSPRVTGDRGRHVGLPLQVEGLCQ